MAAEQKPTMSELSETLTSWRRRPLSGLRWRFTFAYSILFSILILVFSVWGIFIALHPGNVATQVTLVEVAALALIGLGAIAMYILTSFVLRPLRKLSDVAQTITLGDLQQKERLVPLMQSDDEVSKLAASLNVIVDQLELASRIQAGQNKRFRRLFSDASHQLRTPLTSIRGFTEVLMRGAKDDPETIERVLKLMKNETERMTRLINDILMLARLDDRALLQMEELDLVDIAVEAVEQAKVLARDERKIDLHFATDERLSVQANADRLKQVLNILIDNALKYGQPSPDGWVRLALDLEDSYALLQVANNGKGIHEEDLPHIFDWFYRGKHIPTYDENTAPLGTGLGLSIAIAIVQAHQGDISVKSNPEQETVFTVKLPRIKKAQVGLAAL